MSENGSHRIATIYRRIGLFTCSSVFLLFLFGGLVRATGSGMGCPDWPKCFGQLAPPLHEKDLPANYQQIFLEKRTKKLNRFLNTLEKLGMHEKATAIRAEKSVYLPEAFDPIKAWIEYINRLFGVLSGLFALAMVGIGILYRKTLIGTRKWLILGFVFLLLNAWLGSIVVATNLLPGIVSLHFMMSFICLFSFLKAINVVVPVINPHKQSEKKYWQYLWFALFVVVILGTWSREHLDQLRVSGQLIDKQSGWIDMAKMDVFFAIHRYIPVLILIFALFRLKRENLPMFHWANHWNKIAWMCFFQIAFGVIHIVYAIPSWTQIAHVVLGSALLTYSYLILSAYRTEK